MSQTEVDSVKNSDPMFRAWPMRLQVYLANCISISSAVFAQFSRVTNTETTLRATCTKWPHL